jgi:hypothetical protein
MAKLKVIAVAVYSNPRVRKDVWDIVKVVAGVVAARYGIKLA